MRILRHVGVVFVLPLRHKQWRNFWCFCELNDRIAEI